MSEDETSLSKKRFNKVAGELRNIDWKISNRDHIENAHFQLP